MRVLVYPHAMEIGGSQLNAVQLAGAVRDRGHEVVVFSEPGPLVDKVTALGLEHVEIPMKRRRPSPEVLAKLVQVVQGRRIDVVHGYEWPPVIEAFFGPGLRLRTPVVGTVMSMSVVPFFPRTVPLVVGTDAIRDAARAAGHHRVTLLEPPVDTESDNPGVDGRAFRREHGIPEDEVLVAMICRLVPELKLEGLLAACDAVGELAAAGHKVQLVLVGDGRSRGEIEERAAKANALAGRTVVRLTGEVADPRPAYAAADVIVGQGGSALRGMAFGKPLVVVGEQGFSELLTPESSPLFLRQGWYGLGGEGVPELRSSLERLVSSPRQRATLGAFARKLVVDRFALTRAARIQEEEYLNAVRMRPAPAAVAAEIFRSGSGVVASKVKTKYRRWRGTAATDDANATPIVVTPGKGDEHMTTSTWRDRAKTVRDKAEDVVTRVTHMPPRRIRGDISPLWLDYHKTGQDQVDFLRELCGLQHDHHVLDIGCGVGRLAVPLTTALSAAGRYDGFDVMPYMIDWCNRNIAATHPNFHFTHADVQTSIGHDSGIDAADYVFPYEDNTFDLAYAGSLFTHLTPDAATNYMSQVARVLKPGGVFVSTWNMFNSETEKTISGRSLRQAWPHDHGEYRLKEEDHPESNVAFDEVWLRPQYGKAGLTILEPIRPDATYSPLRVPRTVQASHLWYTSTIIAVVP